MILEIIEKKGKEKYFSAYLPKLYINCKVEWKWIPKTWKWRCHIENLVVNQLHSDHRQFQLIELPPHSSSVSVQLSSWFWAPPAHVHYVTLSGSSWVSIMDFSAQQGERLSGLPEKRSLLIVSLRRLSLQVKLTLNSRQTSQKNKRHFKTVASDAVTSRWLVTCQTDVVSPGTSEWESGFSNTVLSFSLPTDINRGHAKSTSTCVGQKPLTFDLDRGRLELNLHTAEVRMDAKFSPGDF